MKLNFKNLPIANLPYEDITPCKHMMLRLYENIPFLAELPKMDKNDTILNRTIENIPGLKYKEKKLIIEDSTTSSFMKSAKELDKITNLIEEGDLAAYSSSSPFWTMYTEMLKRIRPKYTIVRLIGPYSLADAIFNISTHTLLHDKDYRKYIIQAVTVKALWFLNKIKSFSPNTKPIILFEEEHLHKLSSLKRNYDDITNDMITMTFSKVFQKIQKNGGLVGVQSFEKCNWQIILDSNVDLISFDAYNNPRSLNIIAEKLQKFLAKGGIVNWGIVPAKNENSIRILNLDTMQKIFTKAIENLANDGVSLDMLYQNSTVSVQTNLSNIPILFAEKAMMIANQLGKKMPSSSRQ